MPVRHFRHHSTISDTYLMCFGHKRVKKESEGKTKEKKYAPPHRLERIPFSHKKKQQALWPEGQHIVASSSSRYHGLQDDITSHHIPMHQEARVPWDEAIQHLPTYHSNCIWVWICLIQYSFRHDEVIRGTLEIFILTVTSSCFFFSCAYVSLTRSLVSS